MIDTRTAPYAALVLRLSLGVLFLAHAGLKLFVFTPAGTMAFFSSLGLPGVFGLAVIALEVVGAASLILGVYARVFAVLLAFDLLGAVALVHINNGFFFTNNGGSWEYPAFWAVALIVQALLGEGAYALKPTPSRP